MTILSDLRKLGRRSSDERWLLAEAVASLCALQALVRWVPFPRIRALFSLRSGEAPATLTRAQQADAERIQSAIRAAVARIPVPTTCLGQGLAAMTMLARRGVPATLYLGVARPDDRATGIAAHAWVAAGTAIVSGAKGHERFTVVDRLSTRRP